MREVRRITRLTGEYRMIPPIQAIDEICLCPGPNQRGWPHSPGYQIEIVRRLCAGEVVETNTHSYLWEKTTCGSPSRAPARS